MPRFFTGDELGTIKSVKYTAGESEKEWKAEATACTVEDGAVDKKKAVQKLALLRSQDKISLTAARADGTAALYDISENSKLETVHEWKEPRLKNGQRYVGMSLTERAIYTCTSNGALRSIALETDETPFPSTTAALPMRLCDWRMAADGKTFAYGGEEVELSLWDTEKAFAAPTESTSDSQSKKRKRGDQLLHGEIWRAKNVSHDNLSLRQPVHNTALTYLSPSNSSSHHLLTGTQLGNVRRYDTRAARRPVADWKGIGKIGGVSTVEKGSNEHDVFVADHGCNLFALDLRTGRVIYGYKGIAGAVSSVAPSSSFLASVSQDRFFRLHSTFPPPPQPGQQQEQKGEILDKLYMKVVPTVVVWDHDTDGDTNAQPPTSDDEAGGEDDVWDAMEDVDSDDDEEGSARRRKNKRNVAS